MTIPPLRLANVVVGVDDTPGSLHALDLAAAIGAPHPATITAVHVRPVPRGFAFTSAAVIEYAEAEDALDDVIAAAISERLATYPGAWRVVVREGNVAHEILAAADDVDADLVVVGHTAHGTVRDAILGSVAASTLHHSHRSVLIAVRRG